MVVPQAWDWNCIHKHSRVCICLRVHVCVCSLLKDQFLSEEWKVQPVISCVLIFLFRCLIEVVGVYIIEVTSLSRFVFPSLPLSLTFSVHWFLSLSTQTVNGETHHLFLLLFRSVISLQDTCVNGEACGYTGLIEWTVWVCVCVQSVHVCAFRIPNVFTATVLSLVLFVFVFFRLSCLLLEKIKNSTE